VIISKADYLNLVTYVTKTEKHIKLLESRIAECVAHIEERYDEQEPWTSPDEVRAILLPEE
jgi:hypothetical protein